MMRFNGLVGGKKISLCTHTRMIFKRWSLHFRPERRSRPFLLPLPSSHHHCVLPSKDGSRVIPWPLQKKGTSSHPRTRESGWSSVEMLSFLLWPSLLSHYPPQTVFDRFPNLHTGWLPKQAFRRAKDAGNARCEKPFANGAGKYRRRLLTRPHCRKWATEGIRCRKKMSTKISTKWNRNKRFGFE